jgi:hypothetical protein
MQHGREHFDVERVPSEHEKSEETERENAQTNRQGGPRVRDEAVAMVLTDIEMQHVIAASVVLIMSSLVRTPKLPYTQCVFGGGARRGRCVLIKAKPR